jgi:hypothetical protein
MKLSTFNALRDNTAEATGCGSFTVTYTDTAGAYFTEGSGVLAEYAVARQLVVFSAGDVHFLGADGVEDTWTIGGGSAFPVVIPVAVLQVFATGTSVAAGDIKGIR